MDGKKGSGQRAEGSQKEIKSMGQGSKEPLVKLFVKSVEKAKEHHKGEREKEPVEVILSDNEETKAKEDVVVILSENEDEQRDTVQKIPISDGQYFGTLPETEEKHLKKHCLTRAELEAKSVSCTACKKTIDFKAEGTLYRHPVLAVPVCEKCHQFYGESAWSRDEEGYHEHCRWCANGGEMMLCDSCKNVFCQRCIRRNLGRAKVREIEEADEWNCLVCKPTQIRSLRSLYYSLWTYKKQRKEEETKNATELIEKLNKDLSDKIKEDSLGKEEVSKIRTDDTKKRSTDVVDKTHQKKDAIIKTSLKGTSESETRTKTTGVIDIIEEGGRSKEVTNEAMKGIQRGEPIKDSQMIGGTSSSIVKAKPNDEKKDKVIENTNVEERENKDINETNVGPSTSKNKAKTAFMEDTLRDGFDVNKILGDYLKKANKSWGQKKEEELGEESLVKLVVKLRTIVKITHHNLELLDANLVSGCLSAFPGLDPARLNPLTIEGERPQQHGEKTTGVEDKGNNEAGTSKNFKEANEDEQTKKDKQSPQQASVEGTSKTKEEDKKLSDSEQQKGKPSFNTLDHKENPSLSQTSNKSETSKPEKANLDQENLAARAVVLQSTSSESDQAIILETEEDNFSPRKKLKTKKELDNLRRKSVAKTADESIGDNVDAISIGSSSEGSLPRRKSGVERVRVADDDSALSKTSDDSDEDRPRVVAGSSGEKKKGKKMPGLSGPASAKRAAGEKESESDSDNEANAKREEDRENRLTIGKLQKLREVAASIDPKCAKLTSQDLRVDIRALGAEINQELSKSNKKVIQSQLGDLAVKKKLKKRQRDDGSGESEDEDSRIDRLCNLGTLKRSHTASGRRGGSEEDGVGPGGRVGGEVHHKPAREKALGLGDISSDSGSGVSDKAPESEEESPRHTAGQSQEDLARAAVIASSSDESVLGRDSSEESEEQSSKSVKSLPKEGTKDKKDRKRKSPGSSSAEDRRPKSKKLSLLSMRLSESDSSEEERKYRARMEKRNAKGNGAAEKNGGGGSGDSDCSDIVAREVAKKKKQQRKKKVQVESESEVSEESDVSEESEEDEEEIEEAPKKKTSRKKKKSSSSDEDSDEDSDEPKKKRSRIKGGSDSEDEDKTPTKRHNIKKVIKEKNLAEETKTAAAEERDRRKRVEERQAAYNKTFGDGSGQNKDTVLEKLVLDFDPETKKVLVEVNPKLVKKLKPHQADGIKFMWDSVFESVAQFKAGKIPGGAILAHCMGLGKTLQSVTLTHTVMTQRKVGLQRVMVICPVNVVKNWKDEFDKWLPGDMGLDVTEMSGEKDNWGRADRIDYWYNEGGVILMGYDMFRNLTNADNKKFKKKQREVFNRCLLDPGPELVICDEGHLLKNEKSAINKAVNRITTPRRIILTGTPLQNNLKEYYEMVNFVKPNLMGTRKEFMNRFVNPIVNGQHSDSTERDIRMMKKRSFILNDLLKGCMQRLDYNVLVPYLMPKQEYVITIQLTDLQKKLYRFYLENYAKAGQIGADGKLEGGKKGGLFYDVQNLSRIWNHPYILVLSKMRKDAKEGEDDDEEGSLKDFICDEDEDSDIKDTEDEDSDIQEVDEDGFGVQAKKRATRADKAEDLVALEDMEIGKVPGAGGWWNQFLGDEQNLDDITFGSKMVLLMDILKESAMIGDKVLVFSQSILSLDLIEDFLGKVNQAHEGATGKDSALASYLDTWIPGKDYYRMDGSTPADTRKIWCKFFNRATSHRMRLFLISTKAGGLGINLVAANRVIIFDASWNPSHDVQSIFRVFRFGQTKPVYVYRFLAKGTMEEKIYDRQVTKQSLAARVVDEHQIESHFTMNELAELYEFNDEPMSARPTPVVPEDRLLAEVVDKHKEMVWNIHNHDSLLENKVDENLTEEERKAAWDEFDQEKKGLIQTNVGMENLQQFGMMLQTMLPKSGDGRIMASPINPMAIQAQLRQMNPELSHEELVSRTRAAIMQLQNMHRTQTPVIVNQNTLNVGQRQTTGYDQSFYQAEMAKAKAMIQQQYPGMYRFRGPSPQSAPSLAAQAPAYMQQMQMMQRANSPASEVITLDDRPTIPHRIQPGPSMGGRGRGRGGRRGRPRLDPDTDIDFSPEPSAFSQAEVLARLQQAGMTVTNTTRKPDGKLDKLES